MDDPFELDPVQDKREVQAIRREMEDIRREIKVLEEQQLARERLLRECEREGFVGELPIDIEEEVAAYEAAKARIEVRVAAVEKRVADLEERYGVNVLLN